MASPFGSPWLLFYALSVVEGVLIDNLRARHDRDGNILRAGEGNLAKFGSRYYLYVARYRCCPNSMQPQCYQPCSLTGVTVGVYSSTDLSDGSWVPETADAFPAMSNTSSPRSNAHVSYMEPTVFYSPSANHYVLWLGVESGELKGQRVVAVSKSPIGPFELVSWGVKGLYSNSARALCRPAPLLVLCLPRAQSLRPLFLACSRSNPPFPQPHGQPV